MKRPVIGIIPLADEEKESLWMLPGYMEGIQAAGGLPLMLPLTEDAEELEEIAELCDGILLSGGHDVDPALYGAEVSPHCGQPCPRRDRMEKALYALALEKDLPVLGICRGLQLLNVLEGGTLYQDLPSEFRETVDHHMTAPYDRVQHRVEIPEGTPLYELLGKRTLGVNSYHHQGVKKKGPLLQVMATAPDGLIEGLYRPDKRFVWGVQWHPEFSYRTDPDAMKIFECFVNACRGEDL